MAIECEQFSILTNYRTQLIFTCIRVNLKGLGEIRVCQEDFSTDNTLEGGERSLFD